MKKSDVKFDTNKINPIMLNLLEGQVDIILRALELYGYNFDYMINISNADEQTKDKIALIRFTYEQILATRTEQSENCRNIYNISKLGKDLLPEDFKKDFKLSAV